MSHGTSSRAIIFVSGPAQAEPILDPELPIVDSHHHLWLLTEAFLTALEARDSIAARAFVLARRGRTRYLFDELMEDLTSGHNVRATVFVDAHTMYRASGPEAMKSVGEVEFVNGVAAMAASGIFGNVKACAAIVGGVNLSLGDAVEEVLIAHIQAGGGRYRGVRCAATYDPDPSIMGGLGVPHLLRDAQFRAGFKWLHRMGLSFEAAVLEPQLTDVIDLAHAFPDTRIILNHLGGPLGVGSYAGKREERFPIWRNNMRLLARCANVAVKLGGLGMPMAGLKSFMSTPPFTSSELAEEWRPYIQTCIELFGTDRCMFESNFPVDLRACTYPVLWNTFKRLAAGASNDEKTALFSGTAGRVYRLEI